MTEYYINNMNINAIYQDSDLELLQRCTLCPRECGVNRLEGETGVCGTGAGFSVASVCIHRGEEPPVSGPNGICNIFFTGCNLKCVFCQNHEISQPDFRVSRQESTLEELLDQIQAILSEGINAVGFVTPSHVVPQVKAIVRGLYQRGLKPVTVYNTNGYDKPETLRSLADIIDVYLPDMKYITGEMSSGYSGAADYPVVALRALKEMYWQKGSVLRLDSEGRAEYGLMIRHLVLPGHVDESIRVLKTIADELSAGIHISLMSQFNPVFRADKYPEINRPLLKEEYDMVVREMERLGFRNGWTQDTDSNLSYRPDFTRDHPFEH
jgi:putative pyruvate formate lyase activating enzyme